MANRISIQGVEAELQEDGTWASQDTATAADLQQQCGIDVISGSDPIPAEAQLSCAVARFDAVVLERDARVSNPAAADTVF
jgi:hypothetical protein